MSNVIGVINKGRVEQMGDAQAIYERPATRFVAGFIGDTNLLTGKVDSVLDGRAQIKQGYRDFVALGEGVYPGEDVYISVRPEKMRVGAAAQACANHFEGTIVDQVYIGQASKVTVELDGGERVVSTVQIADIGQTIPVGSRLAVGWNPENGVVIPMPLPEEEEAARKVSKAERLGLRRARRATKRLGLAVRLAVFLGIPFLVAGLVIGFTLPDPLLGLVGLAVGLGVFAATIALVAWRLVQSRRLKPSAVT